MQTTILQAKKKKMLLFGIMLLIITGVAFFLGTTLRPAAVKQLEANNTASSSADTKLIDVNEKLQQQFIALQQLDEAYGNAVTSASFTEKADSLNKMILAEENAFRVAIEAAGQESGTITDEPAQQHFERMLGAYRSFIDNRKAISSLRNVVALQQNTLAPDEKEMLKLQDELMTKNNRIAALETTVKTMARPKEIITAKTSDSKWLEQVNELENKIALLNKNNSSLQQTNEKLMKQQNETVASLGTAEQTLKEKNTQLQQKIDDLNAEIQLVKVDCNLNRVDATQIISNAKQRKVLLNEASGILTNLSFSSNADVNRKVKEKITRLNQVAANYRE